METIDSVERWSRRWSELVESGRDASIFAYCCPNGLAGQCPAHRVPILGPEILRAHGLEVFTDAAVETTPADVLSAVETALTGRSRA